MRMTRRQREGGIIIIVTTIASGIVPQIAQGMAQGVERHVRTGIEMSGIVSGAMTAGGEAILEVRIDFSSAGDDRITSSYNDERRGFS